MCDVLNIEKLCTVEENRERERLRANQQAKADTFANATLEKCAEDTRTIIVKWA